MQLTVRGLNFVLLQFAFCGGVDAPDWILAEMAVLSKLTVMQLRRLLTQVIKATCDEELEFEVLGKVAQDASFTTSDLKAAFAALQFIIGSAAKFACPEDRLNAELQQLGLPVELVSTLAKLYGKELARMTAVLQASSLKLNRLEGIEWRVDYLVAGSRMRSLGVPSVSMRLTTSDGDSIAYEMTAEKFGVMYDELKTARALMDRL